MTKTIEVTFKVAMDNEAAKAKQHEEVNMLVDITDDVMNDVYDAAVKSYVIGMQGQIRNNWDKFLSDGTPGRIVFGQPLYAKKAKVVKVQMTQEEIMSEASKFISQMNQAEIMEFAQTGKFPERFRTK